MKEAEASKTSYKGELFRSDLEARWAVFYWEMGLAWTYTENPVEFDSESFEPDFYLRRPDLWTIVSRMFPTSEEKAKASALARRSGDPVYLFYGEIPEPHPIDTRWYSASALAFFEDGTMDEAYWWCECPNCQGAGIAFEGRAGNLPCRCLRRKAPGTDYSHCYSGRILSAYRAAREAKVTGSIDGYDVLEKHESDPFV
jgi:hypothetical protein